jgi:hypothetical protein
MTLFEEIKGFDEKFIIYEDNEIISRLYAKKNSLLFLIIYYIRLEGIKKFWRLQYHFTVIHLKRKLGHSVESMLNYYKKYVQ